LRRLLLTATVLSVLSASAGQSQAGIMFATPANSVNSFSTHPVAASADFSISGDTLTIILTNTNTGNIAKYAPSDALEALFFDVAGNHLLTYTEADASSVRTGKTVKAGPVNITSDWAYGFKSTGLGGSGSPTVTEHYGLGTAGFGIFSGLGGGQQFDYGIMDKGFTGTNGNNPVNAASFAQDSITFTLKFSGKLSESDISDVRFQWGTALNEGNAPGLRLSAVPEPSSLVLMMTGSLFGLSYLYRRRKPA
jgi:hypothetical protein